MIKIRRNVFETSSSSTHAIAFAKNANYKEHPDIVDFRQGEFGWADEEVSPADYLYTYILVCKMGYYDCDVSLEELFDNYYIRQLIGELKEYGIRCTFDGYDSDNYCPTDYIHVDGYIDHQSGGTLSPIFEQLMDDSAALFRYLFASHVYTGNDNSGDYKGEPLRRCLCGYETVECWEEGNYQHVEIVKNPDYDPEHYDYY